MGKEKRKYTAGEATSLITRGAAIRKLQLHIIDFRKLCILKGVYPIQPNSYKKAGRGNKAPKTYYRLKDILYLTHEPIIWKFRALKTHHKKLRHLAGKKETGKFQRLKDKRPTYKLDHIVKERYPTFIDALRDIDDPLTLCCTFAMLRKCAILKRPELIPMSRRLICEFMNYVIASKSLRKVFLSIKGIYYQAEVMGQTITWLTPYTLGYQVPKDVSLRIISTFSEFYVTLLGFINFKLYHSLNLQYPPTLVTVSSGNGTDDNQGYCLDDEGISERVACLVNNLAKANAGLNAEAADEEENRTQEDDELLTGANIDTEEYKKAKDEELKLKKFLSLFEGCKIFLSREVPREALTFVIRSFGGKVSWDKMMYIGATFDENDESITHHIVDRPKQEKQILSRYYVQPQWIFDCVNSRMLIPVEEYFPGGELPPHLSPFIKEKEGDYMPPERKIMLSRLEGKPVTKHGASKAGEEEEEEDIDDFDDVEEAFDDDEGESQLQAIEAKRLREFNRDEEIANKEDKEEVNKEEAADEKRRKKRQKRRKRALAVTPGTVIKTDEKEEAKLAASQELKLKEMMIPKKQKYIYNKIRQKQKGRYNKGKRFAAKREKYEEEQKKLKSQKLQN